MQKKQSYFPHDSNARNSDKLIRLRMRHKAAGYGVYFMILERLREEPDYMSVKDYNMIAFDLREDASLIKSVVEDFGLFVFTEDGKYFYSESLKRRMGIKDGEKARRSEAGKKGMARRWEAGRKLPENGRPDSEAVAGPPEGDNGVITMLSDSDNNVITELPDNDNSAITMLPDSITSKVKKSKVKGNKETSPDGDAKKTGVSFPSSPEDRIDFAGLMEYFNATFRGRLPEIRSIDDKRRKAVRARVAQYGRDAVYGVLRKVAESDFLLGGNDRNWRCDFDWIFKPSNFIKILEGNYDSKGNGRNQEGRKESVSSLARLAEAILADSETQVGG